MAHYALIDENNTVVQVITGVDENIIQTDLDGSQVGGSSEAWEQFYQTRPWFEGLYCKRTSYNNKIRKQFAGIGYTYDATNDVFIAPRPYPSWVLGDNFEWKAPIPVPIVEGKWEWDWYWDEQVGDWIADERSLA
jgi:hypothetical protein